MKDDAEAPTTPASSTTLDVDDSADSGLNAFARRRQARMDKQEESWAAELERFIQTIERGVSMGTDVVKWWQVRNFFLILLY
jgi:hypothetical protein